MLTAFIARIRSAFSRFVRNHIVADEKDLWPDLYDGDRRIPDPSPADMPAFRH